MYQYEGAAALPGNVATAIARNDLLLLMGIFEKVKVKRCCSIESLLQYIVI
jgi:hypothetical protein